MASAAREAAVRTLEHHETYGVDLHRLGVVIKAVITDPILDTEMRFTRFLRSAGTYEEIGETTWIKWGRCECLEKYIKYPKMEMTTRLTLNRQELNRDIRGLIMERVHELGHEECCDSRIFLFKEGLRERPYAYFCLDGSGRVHVGRCGPAIPFAGMDIPPVPVPLRDVSTVKQIAFRRMVWPQITDADGFVLGERLYTELYALTRDGNIHWWRSGVGASEAGRDSGMFDMFYERPMATRIILPESDIPLEVGSARCIMGVKYKNSDVRLFTAMSANYTLEHPHVAEVVFNDVKDIKIFKHYSNAIILDKRGTLHTWYPQRVKDYFEEDFTRVNCWWKPPEGDTVTDVAYFETFQWGVAVIRLNRELLVWAEGVSGHRGSNMIPPAVQAHLDGGVQCFKTTTRHEHLFLAITDGEIVCWNGEIGPFDFSVIPLTTGVPKRIVTCEERTNKAFFGLMEDGTMNVWQLRLAPRRDGTGLITNGVVFVGHHHGLDVARCLQTTHKYSIMYGTIVKMSSEYKALLMPLDTTRVRAIVSINVDFYNCVIIFRADGFISLIYRGDSINKIEAMLSALVEGLVDDRAVVGEAGGVDPPVPGVATLVRSRLRALRL